MIHQWSAYPHQVPLVLPSRLKALSPESLVSELHATCHRRSGKTEGAAVGFVELTNKILAEQSIFKLRRNVDSWSPKLGFLAETKESARNIVWGMFQKWFGRRKDAKMNNHRLTIEFNRPQLGDKLEISLHAFRDHDKLRGQKFRHIHVDEVQKMIWKHFNESIYSTLVDSGGSLATTGTATAVGEYKAMLKEKLKNNVPVMVVDVEKTNLFPAEDRAKILKEIGPFAYRQEYMCDFTVSTIGTFWEERLLKMEKDPLFYTASSDPSRFKVLAVDIGVDEGFAAWYVEVHENGLFFDVLDYYTGYEVLSDLRTDHLARHPMFDAYIIPSDSKTRRLEAKRRRTSREVFREVFPECRAIELKQSTDSYLDVEMVTANISMLRFPSILANSDAHMGLSLLKQYRRAEDANGVLTRRIYKGDKSSHCGDAMKYLFIGLRVVNNRAQYVPSFRVGRVQEDMLYSWTRKGPVDVVNSGSLMQSFYPGTSRGFHGL